MKPSSSFRSLLHHIHYRIHHAVHYIQHCHVHYSLHQHLTNCSMRFLVSLSLSNTCSCFCLLIFGHITHVTSCSTCPIDISTAKYEECISKDKKRITFCTSNLLVRINHHFSQLLFSQSMPILSNLVSNFVDPMLLQSNSMSICA